jgi:hypothetical protein
MFTADAIQQPPNQKRDLRAVSGSLQRRRFQKELFAMKNVLAVLVGTFITAGCAGTSPQMQVIRDAAEALGGQAPIERIKTLVIEGEGIAPNLGQNLTPDTDLPVWKVTEFSRAIDPSKARMRVKQVREA